MPCVFGCPLKSEAGIGSPGAGVAGVCEPPDVSAGDRTQILGSKCPELLSHLSRTLTSFFLLIWVLGIELRASCLQSEYFTCLTIPLGPLPHQIRVSNTLWVWWIQVRCPFDFIRWELVNEEREARRGNYLWNNRSSKGSPELLISPYWHIISQ